MDSQLKSMVGKYVASPPGVYNQLQEAINDPDSDFEDYETIIRSDPALSARLLKIVNSPFYGFTTPVETISHALSVLGIEHVAELALSTGVMSHFKGIDRSLIQMQDFWKHSIACGLASRAIADLKGEPGAEQYYLAGMLHEIGSLVLFKEAPEKMQTLLSLCDPNSDDVFRNNITCDHLYNLEKERFGFNHADLGLALAEDWKLPARFKEALGYHHDPARAVHFPKFVSTVHIADCLVYDMKIGKSGEAGQPKMNPKCLKLMGLKPEDLAEVSKTVTEQVGSAVESFA